MTLSNRRLGRWALVLLAGIALLALAELRGGEASGATAGASATKTVAIKGFSFKPGTLTVRRGTRVAFANTSGVTHTATGAGFDTKRIRPGTAKAVQFGAAGTFAYHCKIHPSMRGKIVVE